MEFVRLMLGTAPVWGTVLILGGLATLKIHDWAEARRLK